MNKRTVEKNILCIITSFLRCSYVHYSAMGLNGSLIQDYISRYFWHSLGVLDTVVLLVFFVLCDWDHPFFILKFLILFVLNFKTHSYIINGRGGQISINI